jgi:hypothetical protein
MRASIRTALLLASVSLAACGGDSESSQEGNEQPPSSTVDSPGIAGTQDGDPRTDRRVVPRPTEPDPTEERDTRTITTPSGAIIITPPRPKATEIRPGKSCVQVRTSARRRVVVPPHPGLRAERSGPTEVTVRYRFPALPPRCRPVALLITLDVNDDGRPGTTSRFQARREGVITVGVPTWLRDPPPDVARMSAFSRDGLRSDTGSVLIVDT